MIIYCLQCVSKRTVAGLSSIIRRNLTPLSLSLSLF